MISRRAFLAAPLTAAAQTSRPPVTPDVLIVWTKETEISDSMRRECIVFPRAYAATTTPELNRRAIETGKFPHAIRAGDFQMPFRQLTARSVDEVVTMTLGAAPGMVVVVTSPGGDGSDSPSEKSLHVPLVIRYAGMVIARNAPEILFSHVDLMPTVFGLTGLAVPDAVQGRNLAPLLTKRQGEVPDSIYAEGALRMENEWRVVIRGYDKAVFSAGGEIQALYNLADDPGEKNDLAKDPANRLAKDGMTALAKVWMRRLNDGFDASGARVR